LRLKQDNSKMEIKIIEEKENFLFNRKEIQASIKAEIVPSRTETEKLIAEKFSTKIENIKIKKIHGRFGSKNFLVIANIYSSEEDKNKLEGKAKEEKPVETPAEPEQTKPEAEPKEEVKEEQAKPDEEPK